jgi:Domain of Unknown Function (DUF1080)
MRHFLCVALFFIAAPAFAQDNTLKPDAISIGRILLFDGETDYGWQGEGTIKAKDGILTIKGDGTDNGKARHLGRFQDFDLSFECRLEGPAAGRLVDSPKATISLNQQKKVSWETDLPTPRNPKDNDWVSAFLSVVAGKVTFGFQDGFRPGDRPGRGRDVQVGIAGSQLEWTIPAGSTLHLKNVIITPPDLSMKKIFNAKDLTGWKEFPGKKSKFSVNAQGEINIKDGPGDLQTVAKYEDFILQLECISNGKNLNSGVFFRCRANEYQNGYEVQIRNQFTKEPTQDYVLEEYDPQTHKLLAKKKAKFTAVDYGTGAIYRRQPARKEVSKDGEWFTLTILAHKNHFMTWVNGIQVADFFDNRPPNDNARNGYRQEAGHISLQGHDPTTDLSYRNIRIAEIK